MEGLCAGEGSFTSYLDDAVDEDMQKCTEEVVEEYGDNSDGDDGLGAGAIAGIVIGCLVGAGLIVAVAAFFMFQGRNTSSSSQSSGGGFLMTTTGCTNSIASTGTSCALVSARHWYRDCPNGGKAVNTRKFGSHGFNVSDFENDHYDAERLQCAMENDDSERFDALSFLAGCEPEMCDELSACSFDVTASGAASALGNTTETPPPPLSDDGTDGTADDRIYPAGDTVHFDNQTFADIIARGPLAVRHAEVYLQHAWMVEDDSDNSNLLNDSESDEEDAFETVFDARRSVVPHHGVCRGGALPPSFRTAPLIPVCFAAVFCVCATTAPLTGQALGGAPLVVRRHASRRHGE
ncbi:hypothetical protein CYMTET_22649 [Cymbomonas tetramitiformis]|uniref:Uncharacterized protein n=1 Tax=Cymbomonas tetramitiformis TaxID=36881 RepID=A0AAE0FZR2_9CHLO|nr:hypothetical protein CYMTET_22649 [Cymbomonas tetramitiformis]